MINDTLNQLVANAKSVMYENTLLFRCEEAEIVARINQEWFKPFAASETMYMMVFEAIEAIKDYSDAVNNN
ncbi:hypothetical protein [Streptococcus mitis]|uniref:hypothetical protein n=1 Tax=Streptococcus mitis TaxID=28037 RepID=UPI001CEDB60E|nr:hypothetical protein [Streptococcus mitis]